MDLVILNEEPSSYLQPMQDQIQALVRATPAQAHLDQPGGVFVRRAEQVAEPDRVLLQAAARVVVLTSNGSLARQLRRAQDAHELPGPFVPTRAAPDEPPAATPSLDLLLFNGLGGFSRDGREYVTVLGPGAVTPAPWCNVVANPDFGFLVSESGAGFTWAVNSQTNRLTPWSNDPLTDAPGEAFYVRDEEDGRVWSPTPLGMSRDHPYVVRHGQGYSVFEHSRAGIEHELTLFVAPNDPVKVARLRLHNRSDRPRTLSVTGYVEWVLGTTRERQAAHVITELDPSGSAILARNAFATLPERVAFSAALGNVRGVTGDRHEFLGRNGSRQQPAALGRRSLSGTVGAGLPPCAAIQVGVELAVGASEDVVFLLGQGADRAQTEALVRAYREPGRVQAEYEAAVARWDELLGAVQVKTPDPATDLVLNRWTLYQALSCRMWGRSGFYQSGGAYGFRDQLQDCMALVHAAPQLAREHILRAAARQFLEGDVQHWWHPESGQGVRSRYSDDMLWLPHVTAHYVTATGDVAILDAVVPFLESRPLEPQEHEVFGVPAVSAQSASLYEHCTRALDRGTTAGPHGLPLMGGGDWNDGMNLVGIEGKGESVWLGWFLAATLNAFAPLAEARGDVERVNTYRAQAQRLAAALDAAGWDGEWYRRAYFDDGTPLGSRENDECSIDALAQSWAAISAVGDPQRARQAMRASEERLVQPDDKMILLFRPPFENTRLEPGYIKGYPAGIRENGGQYTHGVLWTVLATALLGDGTRAHELFAMLNPINHALTAEDAAQYQVEPYVVVADIYSARGHVGRGGWSWYTGSASWMYRIGVEAILGLQRRGDTLRIQPCIPTEWPAYELTYRYGSSRYTIVVENPEHVSRGVTRVELDGKAVPDLSVPLAEDGAEHQVRVTLGSGGG